MGVGREVEGVAIVHLNSEISEGNWWAAEAVAEEPGSIHNFGSVLYYREEEVVARIEELHLGDPTII